MKKTTAAKSVAFFERNTWCHRTKTLLPDGSTSYGKKTGFESQEEAEKSYWICLEQFERDMRKYILEHKVSQDIGFVDYLKYWFEEVLAVRAQSPTLMVYSYVLNDILLPCIAEDVKLRHVNTEYLDSLLEKASKANASAGNKSREFLSLAFADAETEGFINDNCVRNTKPYKRKKSKIKILKKSEIKTLLQAASKGDWYLEILLGLFCGLRKGEILGLKFSDFDTEKSTVLIQRQIGKEYEWNDGKRMDKGHIVVKAPKTENSYRLLRIPKVILTELGKRRCLVDIDKGKLQEEYEDSDFISCQKNGKPHSVSAMNIALTKLCRRNGLPCISVHGLRHMYAIILLEREVPLAKISALLGHSSVNTTFEFYCDIMDELENITAFMNHTFTDNIEERAIS